MAKLASELRVRRRALAGAAHGRVLDLGGWTDHLDAYAVGNGVESVVTDPGSGPFDTVVSILETPSDTVLDALADDGQLLLLGRGRDLPAELRARGLVVTDLDRFEVRSRTGRPRPYVQLRARRPLSSPGSSPS